MFKIGLFVNSCLSLIHSKFKTEVFLKHVPEVITFNALNHDLWHISFLDGAVRFLLIMLMN